jgi:hypothetical protein
MGLLLDPACRAKGGTKWGLVAHTTAMFSLATVFIGMTLDIQSICDVDNRLFSGSEILPPGPLGCQILTYTKAIGIVPSVVWLVNQWLADGLLVSSMSSSFTQVLNLAAAPAVSLLRHLWHELLGDRVPLPDVFRHLG